jgi:hypothetical protein
MIGINMNEVKQNTNLSNFLKSHLVNSTAQATAFTPIFTTFEVTVGGMSDEVSMAARGLAIGITYLGFGSLFAKSRDISRKYFEISQESSEKKQAIHDSLNLAAMNLAISPIFYTVAGARDIKEIAVGTGIAVCFGLTSGPIIGYSMDLYQDLLDMKKSVRIPESIKNMGKNSKKGLAGLLTAASIGLTAGIYAFTPNEEVTIDNGLKVEQVYQVNK